MNTFKKILENIEGYLCVAMLIVMSIVVFIQVICRFILKSSLPWSEELCRYLLVWVSFMGGAYGVKTGAHLGVEAVTLIMPKKMRKVVEILMLIVGIVLCCVILKYGIDIVKTQFKRIQYSPAMHVPMGYAYLAIPVGMVFFILRYVLKLIDAVKNFRKEAAE